MISLPVYLYMTGSFFRLLLPGLPESFEDINKWWSAGLFTPGGCQCWEPFDSSPRHDLPQKMPIEGALSIPLHGDARWFREPTIKQDKSSKMTAVQAAFQIISTWAGQRTLVHQVNRFSMMLAPRGLGEPQWLGYQSQARGPEDDCPPNCQNLCVATHVPCLAPTLRYFFSRK